MLNLEIEIGWVDIEQPVKIVKLCHNIRLQLVFHSLFYRLRPTNSIVLHFAYVHGARCPVIALHPLHRTRLTRGDVTNLLRESNRIYIFE